MKYPDYIITTNDIKDFSIKEKNSVFTGQVYHCEKEDEVSKLLQNVKKKFYDATHHCYAYKFIDEKFKYSDDGEPNGSAGIRILNAIEHFNLTNVIVIVIRYYGGTKLGVGPLGKAYYAAAFNTLNKANKIYKHHYQKITIKSGFNYTDLIHKVLSNNKAIIVNSGYKKLAIYECLVMPSKFDAVQKKLLNSSKGEIKIDCQDEHYYQ